MASAWFRRVVFVGGIGLVSFGAVPQARACGGFFCSQTAPVNQAAERIIFADNGNGTVTAVIQIQYQGPAEKFSWLLPISTVPKTEDGLALASNLAFARLQSRTNPNYSLTTRVEGTCKSSGTSDSAGVPPRAAGGPGAFNGDESPQSGVTVEASGVIGAFEWTVISLDKSLADPADAAVDWLEGHGYDVSEGARGLLRPYLADGLYLLALRLTKGADAGSIRPVALTYDATRPMIPIKLTAVAANENMGVMTWLLSNARGVPQNYLSLELNEAKINWFNASSNYNAVVNAAADEAGGQGFVTELAGSTSALANAIWSAQEEQQWSSFRSRAQTSFQDIFAQSLATWGSLDGFWDAVRATVTLPAPYTVTDLQTCPSCFQDRVQFSPTEYFEALESNVIEPVRMVQKLIDSHSYVTRLYTTMSAAEMTTDPLFTFNPDLLDVSNVHTAERVIECSSRISEFEAPWRIELPQGTVIRGKAAAVGTWPGVTADQPSNSRILRLSNSGPGAVLEDNSARISAMLDDYNATVPKPPSDSGCAMGPPRTAGAGWSIVLLTLFGWARKRRQVVRASSR